MNLSEIIIDRSAAQKIKRVETLRVELKSLGYSVVDSRYLAGLLVQAKRRLETA
jgi:hypothetical protein